MKQSDFPVFLLFEIHFFHACKTHQFSNWLSQSHNLIVITNFQRKNYDGINLK